MSRWVGGDDSNKLAVSLGRHIVVSFIASISHDQSTCFSYFHEDVKIQATNRGIHPSMHTLGNVTCVDV